MIPDGAASVWAVATRFSRLDEEGYVDAGAPTYTTEQLMKCTMTPVLETGDDIAVKNAKGNLGVYAKHGDIPKYATINVEMAIPDPGIEALCDGGTLLNATGAALGLPEDPTLEAKETGGTLKKGLFGYRVSEYNQYGESEATPSETIKSEAVATGEVIVIGGKPKEGALGQRVYGRQAGFEQYMGTIRNLGAQETSAAVTAIPTTSIPVAALTVSIPAGTTFVLSSDPAKPKTVFTTSAFAAINSTEVLVEEVTPAEEIPTKAKINPCFVDTGAITPEGGLPHADTTAGPGEATGYAEPALGSVANEHGVSVEFFTRAIVAGTEAGTLPYWRIVIPKVTGMHIQPNDVTNANMATIMEGQGFQNPNWGAGPTGDWQFASNKWRQRARCGKQIVPSAGYAPVAATA